MVITKEMPISGIVSSWEQSKEVFEKYRIPVDSNKALEDYLDSSQLESIISDLNKVIGSSDVTCIEGG
jgi:hypothetical protein